MVQCEPRSARSFSCDSSTSSGWVRLRTATHRVYREVAWHHYILLESSSATFKVELLHDGVRVQGIVGSNGTQGPGSRKRRRQQLRQADACERVRKLQLERAVDLFPLQRFIAEHTQDKYNLLEWNCQHFSDVVMALYASCISK
jgi:hypothetical protein